jgi:NitT/TauT family transport system ATP-binding protein
MTAIEIRRASLALGGRWILYDVSLDVPQHSIVAIVGASGCGKSTILNLISGLVRADRGEVRVNGKPVVGLQPRKVGYMFARDALLPWRTVLENVELGLEFQGIRNRSAAARRYVEMVGLSNASDKYRSGLSQGMRQRAALARTLAPEPEILLMDEPFSALDAQTRLSLSSSFLDLWSAHRYTVVWVTHDLAEAVALADRVIAVGDVPGRVVAEHHVPFQRPRDILDLHGKSEFQDLVRGLWNDIGQPSRRS